MAKKLEKQMTVEVENSVQQFFNPTYNMDIFKDLELYVVRNQDGKFFRAKGINGSGESWVDDLKRARIYAKIGPARSCVTFFSKSKSYDPPAILKLTIVGAEIVNDSKHRRKVKVREANFKKQQEIREIESRIYSVNATIDKHVNRLKKIENRNDFVEEIAYLKSEIVKLNNKIENFKVNINTLKNS